MPRAARALVPLLLLGALLAGCSGADAAGGGGDAAASASASATPSPSAEERFPEPRLMADDADPDGELRAELVAMFERDQSGRMGGPDGEGDQTRTDRLGEIIREYGWPTITAVGDDGALAAWTISQHSDLDPEFQRWALEHLELAAAEGEATPGNLAYLTDRVAVGEGKPQTYGTQIGCGPNGPEPATPIADEAGVEQRRVEAGLQPLAEYYAELAEICAAEG